MKKFLKKIKLKKTYDEVFYEHLSTFKDKTNDKEFYDVKKNKDLSLDEKENLTNR